MVGVSKPKKLLALCFLLLPSLLGMTVFYIFPILASFFLSFTEWDLLSQIEWVGFNNYIKILKDKTFYEALIHTLNFIILYIPLVMSISLVVALLLNRKIKGVTLFRAVYFLPVITSWVAVSMIWMWIFNPEYGILNYLLSLIGIAGPAWLQDTDWALYAVIITSVWKDIGFVAVIFLAGLQDIPSMYYEAASIDGAGIFKQFANITLPLLSRTTFFVLIISLINSFQVFDQVWIMTEGGPAGSTSVLVEQIYRNAFRYYKMGYASALSWVLFILIFSATVIQNKLQKKWVV